MHICIMALVTTRLILLFHQQPKHSIVQHSLRRDRRNAKRASVRGPADVTVVLGVEQQPRARVHSR